MLVTNAAVKAIRILFRPAKKYMGFFLIGKLPFGLYKELRDKLSSGEEIDPFIENRFVSMFLNCY
jgi:hypothetical protein